MNNSTGELGYGIVDSEPNDQEETDPWSESSTLPDVKYPPHMVQNMHQRSDVDSATFAQHHTLGLSRNQSARGDHIHNGTDSKLVGGWQPHTNFAWTLFNATTASTLGNAVVNSRWSQIGKTVYMKGNITFGTGTAFGAGPTNAYYFVTAPLPCIAQGGAGGGYYGDAHAFDGGIEYSAAATIGVFGTVNELCFGVAQAVAWQQNRPASWASGAWIGWNISYEVA